MMAAKDKPAMTPESLRREIRRHRERSANGKRFLPHGVLEQVVTASTITRCIPDLDPGLIPFILRKALKVFAILVNIQQTRDLGRALSICKQYGLTDTKLPIIKESHQIRCRYGALGRGSYGTTCNHDNHLRIFHSTLR